MGSSGQDVMALKKIISLEFGTTLDTSSSFTSNTASDVKKLQEKYAVDILIPNGLSSGTGTVGPSTETKLNQLASKYSVKLSDFTVPVITVDKSIIRSTLQLGSTGDDVSLLKIVLNSDKATQIAATPAGVTNIFDLATLDAVNRFQQKYANEILAPSGLTNATGVVGAATRKKLNFILNNILNNTQATSTTTNNNSSVVIPTNNQTQNINNSNTTVATPTPVILPIANKADSIAPTITLSANPIQVAIGQPTTLKWTSTNTVGQCKITSKDSSGNILGSTIDTFGSKSSGPINKPTTYTIVCYNKYGIPGSANLLVQAIDPTKIVAPKITYSQASVITSVTPSTANRGDIVTIKGSGFLSTNDVTFDGTKIDNNLILSQSSTSISFKIPDYKSCLSAYCPLPTVDTTVETGGRKIILVSNTNGYSNDFAYILPSKIIIIKGTPTPAPYVAPKLSLSSIQPISGNRGDLVTVYGSAFSSDSIVFFGGFKVADNLITAKTSNSISFKVPPFQMGCTEPEYEICPRLPLPGTGLIIETGGVKNVYIMNTSSKATTTSVSFTLPSSKITY
jgi:hypothetical protein